MLKKTITYEEHFTGETKTEDFYFNLNKGELLELELTGKENSLAKQLQEIAASNDGDQIIESFKKIIMKAYGERYPDGGFYKEHPETGVPLNRKFAATNAYSELFTELATSAESAVEFINGCVPGNLAEQMKDVQLPAGTPELAKDEPKKTVNDFSREELLAMSQEAFDELAGTDPQKMTQDILVIAMQRKNRQ